MGSRLPLLSGGFFDFEKPEDSIYTIEDIATGLSRQYRFGGHTRFIITVAQHSVILSRANEDIAVSALLHDASEAFISDIVRSAKVLLDDYKRLEWRIMTDLFKRVDLDWNVSCKTVQHADQILGDQEAKWLNMDNPYCWPDWLTEGSDDGHSTWDINEAFLFFIKRWEEVSSIDPTSNLIR